MITVHKNSKYKPYPHSKIVPAHKHVELLGTEEQWNMWHLSDGSIVLIKNLRLSHIKNILTFMEARPGWRQKQKPLLLAELDRRQKKKLINKTQAGALLYANS